MKRYKATRAEIREAREEQAYWEELCRYVPWRVHGWSRKYRATYLTGAVTRVAGKGDDACLWNALVLPRLLSNQCSILDLTGEQRDQLVAAFERPRHDTKRGKGKV